MFERLVHRFELVGVNGGAVVRFAGAGGEGGLGVGEQGAHEHRVSSWMLLGSCRARSSPELAGPR